MVKCELCNKNAIYDEYKSLCQEHFIDYFENKVFETIDKYKLIEKNEKICVATSGGKDSITVLNLVNKYSKKIGATCEALVIDEGIKGYRENTIIDLNKFCKDNEIKLNVLKFKENFGKTLDEYMKLKSNPCTVCGTFRRYLLNKGSRKYDKIATGHNMDDEAQAILMNILKGNIELMPRLGIKSEKRKQFTQKIKPLYFVTEKEVMIYTLLKGFQVNFVECPYVFESYRSKVREELNKYELKHRGTKLNIILEYMNLKQKLNRQNIIDNNSNSNNSNKNNNSININKCQNCGEASRHRICKACQIVKSVEN